MINGLADPTELNHALGAVAGALSGDAIGATLEFLGRAPTESEVEHALTMPGGGPFRVAPGQVTDDGELTLALLDALAHQNPYPEAQVAHSFVAWAQSDPFDIGNATAGALLGHSVEEPAALKRSVLKAARQFNLESKANGSLMRASALGVWASKVSFGEAVLSARLNAELTHPNPSCIHANAAYVVAIRHLILAPGDADGAIRSAAAALESDDATEVRDWLDAAIDGNLPPGYPMAGFVRIAFTHAFAHLHQRTAPHEAIRQTLLLGGDTDTNACIVAGLCGALHGASALPDHWIPTMACVDLNQGRTRPDWCKATNLSERVAKAMGVGINQ